MIELTAIAVCALPFLHFTSAQVGEHIGGAPPKEVQMALCTINDMFSKMTMITTDENCRSGCAQQPCREGWMPTADDTCNAQCGRVFEPFCAAPPLAPSLIIVVRLVTCHVITYARRGPVW